MPDDMGRDLMAVSFIPGVGPRKAIASVRVEDVYGGGKRLVVTDRDIERRMNIVRSSDMYLEEMEYVDREGIKTLTPYDEKYPPLLSEIHDPPAVLYCKGVFLPEDRNAVAIVGSRRCSLYGIRMAETLARGLASAGITVVSGMARGIDSAAHRGALMAGGRTIAVMGGGFRHVYPRENASLMEKIAAQGAVLTEYPSDTPPSRGNFPRRNRIISGMSLGVVVVEAAVRSGAMITARCALEQNREVFAVPGRADLACSGGANGLIKDGARMVTGVEDILEELEVPLRGSLERDIRDTGSGELSDGRDDQRAAVMRSMKKERPVHMDEIADITGIGMERLPAILLGLELEGELEVTAGNNYKRKGAV